MEAVMGLANAIKDAARQGKDVPPSVLEAAAASPLSRYVAAKLLWDPFRDTTRLVREYREGIDVAR
jgi:hypothetical protein